MAEQVTTDPEEQKNWEQEKAKIKQEVDTKIEDQLKGKKITEDHKKSITRRIDEDQKRSVSTATDIRDLSMIVKSLNLNNENHDALEAYQQKKPPVINREEADQYLKAYNEEEDFFQASDALYKKLHDKKAQWDKERRDEGEEIKEDEQDQADEILEKL